MCKKLLILVILKPHKYQLLTLFLFCDFRLSAEEKFASSHHFCSFFECLVIFFVSFCLFKRSYKDLVKFSHHFTSGKKSPPASSIQNLPSETFCYLLLCAYDDRPQVYSSYVKVKFNQLTHFCSCMKQRQQNNNPFWHYYMQVTSVFSFHFFCHSSSTTCYYCCYFDNKSSKTLHVSSQKKLARQTHAI